MVGVPGRSKGCVTCRRRKKGVSSEALTPALLTRLHQGIYEILQYTAIVHLWHLQQAPLDLHLHLLLCGMAMPDLCVTNSALSSSAIKMSRHVTNAFEQAWNVEATNEILFGSTARRMNPVMIRSQRLTLGEQFRQDQ